MGLFACMHIHTCNMYNKLTLISLVATLISYSINKKQSDSLYCLKNTSVRYTYVNTYLMELFMYCVDAHFRSNGRLLSL